MPPLRDDYLLRMVEQAFQLLRRIVQRRLEGETALALRDTDDAVREVLGAGAAVLPRLDAATAVPLLADPTRAALWACLLAERAALLRQVDDPDAEPAARRAVEVALEARELDRAEPRLSGEVRDALAEALRAATALARPELLAPRHRGLMGGTPPP